MLTVKKVDAIQVPVQIAIPEKNPVVRGSITCGYIFYNEESFKRVRDEIAEQKLSNLDALKKYVRSIDGIPGDDGHPLTGDAAFEWLQSHEYGGLIMSAIIKDYFSWLQEGRAKN